MEREDREFLLTTAWLFARHGQPARARTLCEALVEGNPRDGYSAAALAARQLEDGEPRAALAVIRAAHFPPQLARAAALLETRALVALGRKEEGEKRWRRYVEAAKGGERKWVG